jgi:hypothetical protein
MKCPGGGNILIQRQKGVLRTALSLGGLAFFVVGMPIVNQLAGCDKIGFEFWNNRKRGESQEWVTEGGILGGYTSGLEKLQAKVDVKTKQRDLEALDACGQLSNAYVWQALHGLAFDGHNRQQELVRKCLQHSKLCGMHGIDSEEELMAGRWDFFADEQMCAASTDAEGSE